jgi:hypothetical protein
MVVGFTTPYAIQQRKLRRNEFQSSACNMFFFFLKEIEITVKWYREN